MSKKCLKAGILILLLGVPVFLYLVLIPTDLTKAPPSLPYFWPMGTEQTNNGQMDTVYCKLQLPIQDFEKKHAGIKVIQFWDTSLTAKQNQYMVKVVESYKQDKEVSVVSLSSESNQFKHLDNYTNYSKYLLEREIFDSTYAVWSAALETKLIAIQNPLFLLDEKNYLRGIYTAISREDVDRLKMEINVLLTEKNYGK